MNDKRKSSESKPSSIPITLAATACFSIIGIVFVQRGRRRRIMRARRARIVRRRPGAKSAAETPPDRPKKEVKRIVIKPDPDKPEPPAEPLAPTVRSPEPSPRPKKEAPAAPESKPAEPLAPTVRSPEPVAPPEEEVIRVVVEPEPVTPEPPAEPEPEPVSPPAKVERPKPAAWQEIEPDDPSDPVPHFEHQDLAGVDGWRLSAASRRGKLHAHHGTYREDAFAIDVTGKWHLVAVSDGAGSAELSRVGSHLAVNAAIKSMKEALSAKPKPSAKQLNKILDQALQAAHAAIHQEAGRRDLPVKDFSATLLLFLHGLTAKKPTIATTQVGDGLIALQFEDGSLEPLAERDSGAFGGETYFLTSKTIEDWLGRGTVRQLDRPPALVAVMTDGVADDFIPYDKYLANLFRSLSKVAAREEGHAEGGVDEVLLQLIGYDKRGSFDDRTLAMLYRNPG